jgi:hypothetical protein
MKRLLAVTGSSSLALAALLVLFTPFLSDFSAWHISGEQLGIATFLLGAACCLSVSPVRYAVFALVVVVVVSSLIEGFVIAMPALRSLVPNPVTYTNLAELEVLIGCTTGGLFFTAGGALGIAVHVFARREHA